MLYFTAQQFTRYSILETRWSLLLPKLTLPFPVLSFKLFQSGNTELSKNADISPPFWDSILIQGLSQDFSLTDPTMPVQAAIFILLENIVMPVWSPVTNTDTSLAHSMIEWHAKTYFSTHWLFFCVVSNFCVSVLPFSLLQIYSWSHQYSLCQCNPLV